ncbi:class I SAM-dependent methyltransferase [Methanoregula sp. UBA64]|jgi:SAM-dependent methyltransferase|uniref:class I SAM-dependent methyltransferase n=1 Tax=Methanoregula sp. UBA64 TaxID=1915554 RepID=UPI0025D98BF4|nr:class I SAM-dependent methyltransferase [Methanoregula sp. UBA64]
MNTIRAINLQQRKNVRNWIECWDSTKEFFSGVSDSEQAESWNRRWDPSEGNMGWHPSPMRNNKRMEEIFALIQEAGCTVEGARILDVGCGPGATSIPFAKAGADVTALDISSIALSRLNEHATKEGVSIKTIETSWWTADIRKLGLKKKFDLVFVTSTPAVRDAGCLDRMIGCSKKFCYYSFSLGNGGPMQTDHTGILQKVLKKDPSRRGNGRGSSPFINGFMYLYLLGYRPLVKINHHMRTKAVDWEEAANRTIRFLDHAGNFTSADKKKILRYYEAAAVDGKYSTRSEGYSGMMVWQVD